VLLVVFLFSILRFLEIQDYPIDTVSQTGRRGTVIEYMTEMRMAAATLHLRPLHPMTVIRQIDHTALADRLIKARPAAPALELGIALEKRIAANRAIICADLMIFLQRTAVWPLCTLLPCNRIDILRKNVLPLIIGQIHRGRVGVRIDRIVCFVIGIHIVDCMIRATYQANPEKC
jgi:hypothetical protein